MRLGWVAADEKQEPALEIVRERVRNEGEGLLLIYDNAIDAASVRPFLPTAGVARALLTSNADVWRGLAAPVEIRVWPKEVGADFLAARTGRAAERYDAEALSEELGGLPLAHEQAAAYCERLDVSFAEYRKRFEAAPARLLDADKDASADYRRGLTIAKTFALAIDEAAKLHPAAEPLITYAALLSPEPIRCFCFSEAREKFGKPLHSEFADDSLDEAVAALRAFALIDRETITDERDPSITTEAIRLHRLVRAGWRRGAYTPKQADTIRREMIEAIVSVYPGSFIFEPRAWPRARRLDALILGLVGNDPPLANDIQVAASQLYDWLGSYRHATLAAYPEAQLMFERALAIRERFLGSEHVLTGVSLNNLALVVQDRGDLSAARPLLQRAVAINEKVLGAEHRDTAANIGNLAKLLLAEGDYSTARPFAERAVAINQKVLGLEHLNTARQASTN